MESGRRVVKPMRYHCRPSGKPAFYDEKYPGTDCARRNNLCRFWKGQYGYTHGLVLVDAFYEYVAQPDGTDDPPLEIAEAGHDRCPVPIKPENIDAWLNPEPRSLDASDAILEDKLRPYYTHRQAAPSCCHPPLAI